MFKKLQKPNSEGFTIIEIMIVLVIAALILLIVFLAVPALQRSSRNTSRKSDAGRMSSAIGDFISNSNGNLPGGTNGANWLGVTTDCKTITGDAGSLAQYNTANNFNCAAAAAAPAANKFIERNTPGGMTVPAVTGQSMFLMTDAACNPNATSGNTLVVNTGTTNREVALAYTVEPSGGQWLWNCVTVQ